MNERFLWWTGAEWTAIGTCVLAVITLVYVVLMGRILKHTSRSADAAELAAKSAAESAAAAQAQLVASFQVIGSPPVGGLDDLIGFSVVWGGHVAYIHEVRVRGGRVRRLGAAYPLDAPAGQRAGVALPIRMQAGDVLHCSWPPGAGNHDSLVVDVTYTFDRDSAELLHQTRTITGST